MRKYYRKYIRRLKYHSFNIVISWNKEKMLLENSWSVWEMLVSDFQVKENIYIPVMKESIKAIPKSDQL